MNKPIEHGQAIVLRLQDYKDNAVLITMLVKDVGQLRLIGKGQLKTTSKLAPICQPFNTLLIGYIRAYDSTLGQLIQASCLNSRVDLSFDLYQSIYGQIITELIEKITFDMDYAHVDFYDFTNDALNDLFEDNIHDVMMFYLLHLMDALGYRIDIELPEKERNILYRFNIEAGRIEPFIDDGSNHPTLSLMQLYTIMALLNASSFHDPLLNEFDPIDPALINDMLTFIRYHLGFDLKSARLLQSL